jgi:phenylacetate-CoA ligase
MNLVLTHLGSPAVAEGVALRAERSVAAYRGMLAGAEYRGGSFAERPVVDKAGYLARNPLASLLGDDADRTFSIIASSGSSGRPFYWPQLKEGQREAGQRLLEFLRAAYAVDRRRTIAVVGLALGSWIGGDVFSWALKNAAIQAPFPLAVFAPGNRHDEILRFIDDARSVADQFLIVVCPSAIGHLRALSESLSRPLPWPKLRFLVLGEAFPESLRASIHQRAGLPPGECPILSVYGSADTGLLGVESPATAAARAVLSGSPSLQAGMGLGPVTPHLFHAAAPDAYLETIDGELVVTRWQGIPLVRYNLHDAAHLVSWRGLRGAILDSGQGDSAFRAVIEHAGAALPDLIAISGRADRCLILCGTNLTEAMLDHAVAEAGALAPALTGRYRASVVYEADRQRLAIELEARDDVPGQTETDGIYDALVRGLARVQPEFEGDWTNVYKIWDRDPQRRIIRLGFVAWPAISGSGGIKSRGIAP